MSCSAISFLTAMTGFLLAVAALVLAAGYWLGHRHRQRRVDGALWRARRECIARPDDPFAQHVLRELNRI